MITIDKALNLFMIDQELNGNSEKTQSNYSQMIGYFINYVGIDKDIDSIGIEDIKQYQLYLMHKNKEYRFDVKTPKKISKTTVRSYMVHLRAFFIWLYDEEYIKTDFSKKIKPPKAPKKTVEILSEEEIETLYRAINDRTEFGLRNKCMISLMLDSGLRVSEVLTLEIDSIHFTQNVIKVNGKGDKERIVPLGLYTKRLLYKYLHGYRPMPDYPSNIVFMTQDRKPVTYDSVKMVFQRLKKKTGITRLSPHFLRHTFATRYLINEGDAFSLQMILGHTSLKMTRKYSHLASSYTVKNFKNLSTLDRLKGRNVRL